MYPNVYEILEIFKQEQSVTEFFINQLASGGIPSQSAKRNISKEKRIKEIKQRFTNNVISLDEYVQTMDGHTNITI